MQRESARRQIDILQPTALLCKKWDSTGVDSDLDIMVVVADSVDHVISLRWSPNGTRMSMWWQPTFRGGVSISKRFPLAGGEGVVVPGPERDDAICDPYERPPGLVWVCEEGEGFSDVWMIENFDSELAERSR